MILSTLSATNVSVVVGSKCYLSCTILGLIFFPVSRKFGSKFTLYGGNYLALNCKMYDAEATYDLRSGVF
jgi:hypothetical protein